jgi:hypothetical protein
MVPMRSSARLAGDVRVRGFRIVVANCRRCGREWPAHVQTCSECAAVVGEPRSVDCQRLVPPAVAQPVTPVLAVVAAIELSRRGSSGMDGWAGRTWSAVAPLLARALRVGPGHTGAVVASWPLECPEAVDDVGELALVLGERLAGHGAQGVELRGGIAVGVVDERAGRSAVERWTERLALAASAGQWLVSQDAARGLERRFVLRPAGIVSRWPLRLSDVHRALASRLAPPVLPSAVSGDPPELVLGRARERRRLLAELAAVAAERRRRVVLVSAPAGGGKSYLLRRLLADSDLTLAAGVAFPPLGSRSLDPVRALVSALDDAGEAGSDERLGEALAQAATRRARVAPCAIVIDDIHWAGQAAVATLARAIRGSAQDTPLAWVLSMRTAALSSAQALAELADATVELPPLEPQDRVGLLAERLGALPDKVRRHVAAGAARGNPLYLEHLAAAINEGSAPEPLPATLHEAVLTRLDGLAERVGRLTRWSSRSFNVDRELEELETEVGDWLDRLETSDIADLATIGRYLARLRAIDVDLVVARSIVGMPVAANRRLAVAVERLAAASTDALLAYLEAAAGEGRRAQAAQQARAAAESAERALRLADAERLLGFASCHDQQPALARKRGDLALALGRPEHALTAYQAAAARAGHHASLQRRTARAEALLGDVDGAIARLQALLRRPAVDPQIHDSAALDLARLLAEPPPPAHAPLAGGVARRIITTEAWARPGDPDAARKVGRSLVLAAEPAACAAELIETAVLARFARLTVSGLDAAAAQAAHMLDNPRALDLLAGPGPAEARRTFVHWDV